MKPAVTIDARIATSGELPKYPGYPMSREAMQEMVDALNAGSMPHHFEHDVRQRMSVRVIEARLGVPGGFSYTSSTPLQRSRRGPAQLAIAADAAAWTDDQREEARSLLDAEVPTDSHLLFQFSAAADVAAVFVILAPGIGSNLLSDALVVSLKRLVRHRRREGQTRIEIRRRLPDGTEVNAILTTDDPEHVEAAIRSLPQGQDRAVITFDDESWDWPER
jgi:hypothetical protein